VSATVSIRSKFAWDKDAQRYRLANGRFVKETAVKQATLRTIKSSQAEMQRLTTQLNRGELTIENWCTRFASELKNLHVSGAMAGGGGMANMTQADYGRIGQELRFQYRRLGNFAAQIKAGELTDKQIEGRTNLYVASMNKTFEAARRTKAAEVMQEERNILGATDQHCAVCIEQTARGWVPIGLLVPIGARTCMANCKCRYSFRKTPKS